MISEHKTVLTLRSYQPEAIELMVNEPQRNLLFDETKLGKTITVINVLKRMSPPLTVVVCPKSVPENWQSEFGIWWPEAKVHIALGDKNRRDKQLARFVIDFAKGNPSVLIISYGQLQWICEIFGSDLPPLDFIIYDECQIIKNYKTQAFKAANKVKTNRSVFLSGTPAPQGPQDLWTYLHLIDRVKWSSYWNFVKKYLVTESYPYFSITGPKYPQQIRNLLAPYIIRRLRKDHLAELGFSRQGIFVDMTPEQKRLYNELTEQRLTQTDSGKIIFIKNGASLTLRHRQMLVTPKLLGIDAPSAGLQALRRHVDDVNAPIVVFTPFVEAFPYIRETLQTGDGLRYIQELSGNDRRPEQVIRDFEEHTSDNKVLIASIRYSRGYNIHSAEDGVFIGAEWSPEPNHQSEGRLRGNASFKYIVNRETVDVHVLDIVEEKIRWSDLTLNPKELFHPTPRD